MHKNIIIVTSELPFPANSGGKIYTWDRIKLLSNMGYNITLFSLRDIGEDVKYDELKKVCKEVFTYEKKSKLKRALIYFYYPFTVATRKSNEMKDDINKYIKENNIDLVIADSAIIAVNVKTELVPIIITQHNIEHKAFKTMSSSAQSIIKKIAYYREYILCTVYERILYKNRSIKGYTFISEKDMSFFRKKYTNKNCLLVPMGWNETGEIESSANRNSKKMIYTGQMNYEPNVQAVVYFAKNIFGNIKREVPEAEFIIVGKKPVEEVKQLENIEGITVTGYVESIDPYMRDCSLVVIPLLSGGGVKIKLFEALSYKKIVVSTSTGAEGTIFEDKKDLFIEDDKEKFANKCIEILRNYDTYKSIGENGYKTLVNEYSWEKIGERYDKFIQGIINKK